MDEDKEALRKHLKIPKAWRLRNNYWNNRWIIDRQNDLDRPEGWIVQIEKEKEKEEGKEDDFDVNKFKLYYESFDRNNTKADSRKVYPSDWEGEGENWKKLKGGELANKEKAKILEWDSKNRIELFEKEAKEPVKEETEGDGVVEEEEGEQVTEGAEEEYPYNLRDVVKVVNDVEWKISKEEEDDLVYYFKKDGDGKRYYEDSTEEQAPNEVIEAFNPPEAWKWVEDDNGKYLYNTESNKTMWSIQKRTNDSDVFDKEDEWEIKYDFDGTPYYHKTGTNNENFGNLRLPTEADKRAEEVACKKDGKEWKDDKCVDKEGGGRRRRTKRKRKSKITKRKSKRRVKRRKSKSTKRKRTKRRIKRRKSKRKMKRRKSKRKRSKRRR